MAAGSGKVVFAGYTRGYGKLIKIRHSDGYMTLYVHQKSFKRGIKRGKYVKKGQVIGYVGSTGLSTGPHLHFGLYKNGRAINPARVVQVTTHKLKGEKLKAFKQLQQNYNDEVELYLAANRLPEQIKAYRDTWKLGIHSYLTYLRDRLLLARELLAETGSIFVQINDENLHLVRSLLDEVFGGENFGDCSLDIDMCN